MDKGEHDGVDGEHRVAGAARGERYDDAGDEKVERQGSHKKILPHFVSKERDFMVSSSTPLPLHDLMVGGGGCTQRTQLQIQQQQRQLLP